MEHQRHLLWNQAMNLHAQVFEMSKLSALSIFYITADLIALGFGLSDCGGTYQAIWSHHLELWESVQVIFSDLRLVCWYFQLISACCRSIYIYVFWHGPTLKQFFEAGRKYAWTSVLKWCYYVVCKEAMCLLLSALMFLEYSLQKCKIFCLHSIFVASIS